MKPCRSFAVYPTLLDVMCARARVRVAESGGFGALRCPLTLFHASFLPICSTFPHSSPLPNSASLSIPPLSSPPKKIKNPASTHVCHRRRCRRPEQDLQALVGAARVRGARARERGRGQGAAAVRPEGHRPGGAHRHREPGGRRQVRLPA